MSAASKWSSTGPTRPRQTAQKPDDAAAAAGAPILSSRRSVPRRVGRRDASFEAQAQSQSQTPPGQQMMRSEHQQQYSVRRSKVTRRPAGDSPATAVKRNRRQWVLGEPVLLRAASGEVLQADPGGREAAQLLRTAAAPPQTTPTAPCGDLDDPDGASRIVSARNYP